MHEVFLFTDNRKVFRRKTEPITDNHSSEKAFAYLKAGTQLVWVIEPVAKTVMIYRSETDFTLLSCEDTLTGEDVVAGFACPVAQLFE